RGHPLSRCDSAERWTAERRTEKKSLKAANWTPTGFIGQLLRTVGQFVPPPAGVRSPVLWGTDVHIRELFPNAERIDQTPRTSMFRYRSPEHWVEVFRNFYGPVHKASSPSTSIANRHSRPS